MDYRVYYGEISEGGRSAWDEKEISPFDVLKENLDIEHLPNWISFLGWARRNLRDEVQIDWGSFAWRCCGSDLQKLMEEDPGCRIEGYDKIEPEKEYGVVFIEMA